MRSCMNGRCNSVYSWIVMQMAIPLPVKTHMLESGAMVCSTVSIIMCRNIKIEKIPVGIVNIDLKCPAPSVYFDWPIEIAGSQKPAVLVIAKYPSKIIVAYVQ